MTFDIIFFYSCARPPLTSHFNINMLTGKQSIISEKNLLVDYHFASSACLAAPEEMLANYHCSVLILTLLQPILVMDGGMEINVNKDVLYWLEQDNFFFIVSNSSFLMYCIYADIETNV